MILTDHEIRIAAQNWVNHTDAPFPNATSFAAGANYVLQKIRQTDVSSSRPKNGIDLNSAIKLRGYFAGEDAGHFHEWAYSLFDNIVKELEASVGAEGEMAAAAWRSVEDWPLIKRDEKGRWVCTEHDEKQFIAAIPCADGNSPGSEKLWWVRHCVIEDGTGLCVVGDDENIPAGFQVEDVLYWMPWPEDPE